MKVRQLFFVTLMIGSTLSKTAHNCAKRIITANSPQAIITSLSYGFTCGESYDFTCVKVMISPMAKVMISPAVKVMI